mmetsp:Transcript_17133/g.46394  ORF Transcript_17133/g.46394 Transcript_17133/m.46394 type:complete len:235 (+) Transcript_17133:652-1356(+)
MVLVVVAHVEEDQVQWTIVRVGLLPLGEHVVLRDEVPSSGMDAPGNEEARNHVADGAPAEIVYDGSVKEALDSKVERMHGRGLLRLDHHGAQSVEENLADAPHGLAHRPAEEPALELGGDVRVHAVHALLLVMLNVVLLEGDAVREHNGQVGPNGNESVRLGTLGAKIVCELMNREEERVRNGGAHDVECGEVDRPGCALQHNAEGNLRGNEHSDNVLGAPLGSHELVHLRVLL